MEEQEKKIPKYLVIPWNTSLCRNVTQQYPNGNIEKWQINDQRIFVFFLEIEEPIVLFRSADLLINLNTRQVWREGVELSIKREGFSLLRRLVLDYRLTKSREELMMITKRGAMDNALSHCVSRLRNALGTYRGQPYIDTVTGVGYRWHFPVVKIE